MYEKTIFVGREERHWCVFLWGKGRCWGVLHLHMIKVG